MPPGRWLGRGRTFCRNLGLGEPRHMGPFRRCDKSKLLERRALVWLAALGLLSACGKPRAPDAVALQLEPVPAAPVLQIAAETVPEATGALAVVAARPQGVAGSDVRPTLTFSRPVMALSTVE